MRKILEKLGNFVSPEKWEPRKIIGFLFITLNPLLSNINSQY